MARLLSDDAAKTIVQAFISCCLDWPLSRAAWTTATHYWVASLTVWFSTCSRCKTRQCGWSLELISETTSHRYWGSFTSCLWGNESISRSQYWCTSLSSWSHPAVSVGGLPTRHGSGMSAPPVSGRWHLRSSSDTDMAKRQKFRGCCLRLRNNLPVELRQRDICLSEFRWLLKTFLFCWDLAPCDFLFKCAVYKYTYVLTYLED